MGKHTPGPWAFEFHPDNEDERKAGSQAYSCVYIGQESDEPPGRVWRTFIEGGVTHGPEQGDPEADLRLISAAPELYEALRGFIVFNEGPLSPDHAETYGALLGRARAALLKAEGK